MIACIWLNICNYAYIWIICCIVVYKFMILCINLCLLHIVVKYRSVYRTHRFQVCWRVVGHCTWCDPGQFGWPQDPAMGARNNAFGFANLLALPGFIVSTNLHHATCINIRNLKYTWFHVVRPKFHQLGGKDTTKGSLAVIREFHHDTGETMAVWEVKSTPKKSTIFLFSIPIDPRYPWVHAFHSLKTNVFWWVKMNGWKLDGPRRVDLTCFLAEV